MIGDALVIIGSRWDPYWTENDRQGLDSNEKKSTIFLAWYQKNTYLCIIKQTELKTNDMSKRNFHATDKNYKTLVEGDIVVFADTNGILHQKPITTIIAKYVIPTDVPQCDEVRYSKSGIGMKRQPTDVLLHFDMGKYHTPVIVSARNTFKVNT
jgi:hypothetical protein